MHRPAPLSLRVSALASPRSRVGRTAAAAALAAAGLGLSACSTQSPAQTQVPYQPADGVNTQVGAVDARGLVIVAASKGATGVLIGSLINTGNDPVTVTFLTADQVQNSQGGSSPTGQTMQLKAKEQTRVSGVQFANLPAAPGALTSIVLQTQKAGQSAIDVPVLPPDGYYSTSTPMVTNGSSSTSTGTASTGTGSTGTASTGSATTGSG